MTDREAGYLECAQTITVREGGYLECAQTITVREDGYLEYAQTITVKEALSTLIQAMVSRGKRVNGTR